MKVNQIFQPALESTKRYVILWGSAGSGKSWFAIQKIIIRILSETGHRFLVCRKVAKTIRESCFKDIKKLIELENLTHEFEIRETDMHIKCKRNGNEIVFAGLDDVEKLKSISTPSSIWCEEPTEMSEIDFAQIELRMRGETQNYKQFILTFNPIDEDSWVKKRFFDTPDDQTLHIHANYNTNAFLDADYIYHLEQRIKFSENLYRIYVKGEWGKATYGGEFYKCFQYSKHVGKTAYKPLLPLHITWDFNVNPYVTCLVWQIEGKKAYQLREICLPHPRNTNMAVCDEFERLYPSHIAGLFIYGDPSGLKQSTADETTVRVHERDYSEFTKICDRLERYRPQTRIPRAYPPVKLRGNFMNSIFDSNFSDIHILIDESCKNTIADLMYGKEAPDGTKFKEKVKDEKTGVTYEKYFHAADALDYLCTSAFSEEFYLYQSGGREPLISIGQNVSRNKGW